MADKKFRSCVDARAYMYAAIATMMQHELDNGSEWIFGGIEDDFDTRRLVKEVKKFRDSTLKRARKLRGEA